MMSQVSQWLTDLETVEAGNPGWFNLRVTLQILGSTTEEVQKKFLLRELLKIKARRKIKNASMSIS